MTTNAQANRALELLRELKEINDATGGELITASYLAGIDLIRKSIKRRLALELFEGEQ